MKKILIGILTMLVMINIAMPLFAENAGDKLSRGLVNVTTGWIELPKQMCDTTQGSNAFAGVTWGAIKGIGYTAARMGIGAVDTLTFIIPPYDKPVMEPKYAFSK